MLKYSYDASGNMLAPASGNISPPQIMGQPVQQIAEPGQVETFSVVIADAQGATFQWRRNGGDMAGETGDSLVRSNVGQPDDGNLYSVVVTNSAGSVTSASAALWLDTDRDGLPDSWEIANFTDPDPTHPLNPANQRGESDPDHDGISNLDEFLDGTDPTKTFLAPGVLPQRPRVTAYSDAGGSVTVEPMKLSYDVGETVTLTATPFAPSIFIGWSGDLSGKTTPASLTLTERPSGIESRTVRARFATPVPPPLGLVAFWRGETDASDLIGGHHGSFFDGNGTPVATPSISAAGKVGGAFDFDGNVHVRVPASDALKPAQLTVEAWVFPTGISENHQTIIAHGSSTADNRTWYLAYFSFFPGFSTFPPSDVLIRGPLQVIQHHQWAHLALTFDGTTMRVYVNGAQVAWQGGLGPLVYDAAAVPLTIGSDWVANASGARFTGLIDELALYNRALTPNEVFDIYNADFLGKDITRPYFTSPSRFPNAALGVSYASQQMTTVLAAAPTFMPTFSLETGMLPPGLSLSSAGVVSGTPSMAGHFDFAVRATDVFARHSEQLCTLQVA